MTLTIDLPPDLERRLQTGASRLGLDAAEYVRRLIATNLPAAETELRDQATLELFAQWDAEDETTDPEEIARRQQDFAQLAEAMNRNRLESGGANARRAFP